jgi:CTP-dependent riboflavin kinase
VFLDAKIWKLISTINGRNSVQDICTMLGASEFSVSKVLYHLHGRKIIERVAVVRPLEVQLREPLFEEMESTLAQYVGPMASLVIEDSLKSMGKSRDYVSRNDLPLLVEKVSENVDDEGDRIQYQGAMLALIQKLPREGE